MAEPDFVKGASGPDPYASGLGIAAPYLGGASASASASALGGSGADGWVLVTGTFAYSSADAPTFVATTPSDQTASIGVGTRVKLTQTTDKYFIVTAISGTTLTLYGGTDYTLANVTITAFYYSQLKAPVGFPMNPVKWTAETLDTSDRTQADPVAGTYYNPGSVLLSVPIGAWNVTYQVIAGITGISGATVGDMYVTLSTSSSSETDVGWTIRTVLQATASGLPLLFFLPVHRSKVITLAAKTSYFLNAKTGIGGAGYSIAFEGSVSTTTIRAVCAYL